MVLPLSPLGPLFGFVAPPPVFYSFVVAAVLVYLMLVEAVKRAFYRLMARQEVPPLAGIAALLFGMPAAEVAAGGEAVEAAAIGLEDEEPPSDDAGPSRGRRRA